MTKGQISFIIGVVSLVIIISTFAAWEMAKPELTAEEEYRKAYYKCVEFRTKYYSPGNITKCNDIKEIDDQE